MTIADLIADIEAARKIAPGSWACELHMLGGTLAGALLAAESTGGDVHWSWVAAAAMALNRAVAGDNYDRVCWHEVAMVALNMAREHIGMEPVREAA